MRVAYVTHEEAGRLEPLFRYAKEHGPYKEARESAGRILRELSNVRPVDYSPIGGYQLVLDERDYEFYRDMLDAMGG